MGIVVVNSTNVEVDGKSAGDAISVVSNYPTRKAETLAAFQAYEASTAAAAVADATKLVEEMAATHKEELAARDAQIADLKTAVDALGTTEQGLALAKQQKIAALKAEAANKTAEAAALEAAVAEAVKE